MKTEHRGIIAVVLSAAFFIAWYAFYTSRQNIVQPEQPRAAASQEAAAQTGPAETKPAQESAPAVEGIDDPQARIPQSTVTIKNDLVEMELSNDGAVVTSWKLADYRQATDEQSPLIDLATQAVSSKMPLMFTVEGTGVAIPERPRFEVAGFTGTEAVFRWRRPGEISIVKKVSLNPAGYVADVSVEIVNESARPMSAKGSLAWSGINIPVEKKGFFSFMRAPQVDIKQPIYFSDGKVHREKNAEQAQQVSGALLWSGLDSRYFLSAIIPRVQGEGTGASFGGKKIEGEKPGATELWASASLPAISLAPGQSGTAAFSVYSGPKDIKQLKAMNVSLEKAIDYGWFTVIAIPILYLLKFFHSVIHNYGVAIILLTIFVKLLLHPINIKSLKSMKEMQKLQPRLKELRDKCKGDKQKLNAETMQLFRAHKVNPMGGCLPMLLQLPIYIALYKVLWSSIELYHAPFFWFYRDLSAPDPYLITPILLGLFMVAQQHLTPSASADPTQKKMMMFMPIMFTMFMLFLPVGLVIYILVNTVMSVTQQWMYNRGIGFLDIIRGRAKLRAAKAQ